MGRKLNDKSALLEKLLWCVFITSLVGMIAFCIYYCRNLILACHDSMDTFVLARIMGWKYLISGGFKYTVSRGRFGILAMGILILRYLVLDKGNYLAIWLLQYIPVYLNIFTVALLIAKHTRREMGIMFALFFMAFLQINNGHSLIICYPLEFMFALFICIIALVLYESWLKNPKVWKIALSVYLFYESIQVYEAFIVAALCYAILALNFVLKTTNGQALAKRLKCFVFKLIPHIVASVLFLIVFVLLHKFPLYPEREALDLTNTGSVSGFFKTWAVLSTGMFPLRNFFDQREEIARVIRLTFMAKKNILITGTVFVGFAAGIWIVMKKASGETLEEGKKTRRNLIVIGSMGLAAGLTFAMPHALLNQYQTWVKNGTRSYVPSTFCYFGWCVFIVALLCLCLNLISKKRTALKIVLTGVLASCFAICGLVTACTNDFYRHIDSSASPYESIKAQAFYSMADSETIENWDIDLIFTPKSDYHGIHNNIAMDEGLLNTMAEGLNAELVNESEFVEVCENYNSIAVLLYDDTAEVAYLIPASSYEIYEDETFDIYTSEQALVTSVHSGNYALYNDGTFVTSFSENSWDEVVIGVPYGVPYYALDIVEQ